jgi:hypothetical protein
MGASGGGPASPIFTVDGITFSLDPAMPSPSFTFLPPAHMTSTDMADTIKVWNQQVRLMAQCSICTEKWRQAPSSWSMLRDCDCDCDGIDWTVALVYSSYTSQDLRDCMDSDSGDILTRALSRGIGVHHGEMPLELQAIADELVTGAT